jgi:hypothetical protein
MMQKLSQQVVLKSLQFNNDATIVSNMKALAERIQTAAN